MRIDAKTCKVVEERSTGGVYGQASFTRLVDIMLIRFQHAGSSG